MSSSMRAIRARIRSIEGTRKITSSMKVVAASKMRRVQKMRGTLTAFSEKSEQMLAALLAGEPETDNPYLRQPPAVRTVTAVVFLGNRGLCGSYNQDLMAYLTAHRYDYSEIVICGAWGQEMLRASNLPIIRYFDTLSDVPTPGEAAVVADFLKTRFREGRTDRIELIYQKYLTALTQQVTSQVYLPVMPPAGSSGEGADCLYEPGKVALIDALTELYTGSRIHAVMLESRVSEHNARMRAMTAASDNTEDMIRELTMALNHARQAAITTEIAEIVGGASALRSTDHPL